MAFNNKPVLVFWEMTNVCPLKCIHCRADAINFPEEGQMSTEDGKNLIEQIAGFGTPAPLLIFTGGDPMSRTDLEILVQYASSKGIKSAIAPAVSESLSKESLKRIKELGVLSISISLDSSAEKMHDYIRGVPGTYKKTIQAIKDALSIGLNAQINTVVMKHNISQLPAIFQLIRNLGITTWEVFFLITTGRGSNALDIEPEDYESTCNFLYDASQYGVVIRTVEAPFIRRIVRQRREKGMYWMNDKYKSMREDLYIRCGKPFTTSSISMAGTLDGDGILFVSYTGSIYPGGFLPVELGNIKHLNISTVYRDNELLLDIRNRKFSGPCGACSNKDVCGGSRARAFAYDNNILGSDPACIYTTEAKRFTKKIL